jgi:hypothetical protein
MTRLVGSEMCIRDRGVRLLRRGQQPYPLSVAALFYAWQMFSVFIFYRSHGNF